jgi:hypothetical protein
MTWKNPAQRLQCQPRLRPTSLGLKRPGVSVRFRNPEYKNMPRSTPRNPHRNTKSREKCMCPLPLRDSDQVVVTTRARARADAGAGGEVAVAVLAEVPAQPRPLR